MFFNVLLFFPFSVVPFSTLLFSWSFACSVCFVLYISLSFILSFHSCLPRSDRVPKRNIGDLLSTVMSKEKYLVLLQRKFHTLIFREMRAILKSFTRNLSTTCENTQNYCIIKKLSIWKHIPSIYIAPSLYLHRNIYIRVYDVGIDVRFGQGRFRDTRIVTFAPRYQFENRSAHILAFQQRHFVREQVLKTTNFLISNSSSRSDLHVCKPGLCTNFYRISHDASVLSTVCA